MNQTLKREIGDIVISTIAQYTGPVGGWTASPSEVREAIIYALAEHWSAEQETDKLPLLAKQLSREYNFSSQADRDQALRLGKELYDAGVSEGRP